MKPAKLARTVQQIRVCTYQDSLCITSVQNIPEQLFKKIVNLDITTEYKRLLGKQISIIHNCISYSPESMYASSLMLRTNASNNTLDKIVELSIHLTSLHYELLRRQIGDEIIKECLTDIKKSVETQYVIKHDAQPRKHHRFNPFKHESSKPNNETLGQ